METKPVNIDSAAIQKLLGAANPDAALLYLFIQAGNSPDQAGEKLRFSETRISASAAVLRQLGMWPEKKQPRIQNDSRPAYSETDVLKAMDSDTSFRGLVAEIQHALGRPMNTEEMKIVLGFIRYLGLPADVVNTLVYFCRDRMRRKGSGRAPGFRAIEQEAYRWAENGIDTLEEAAAYIQNQNYLHSRICEIMEVLQIHGRKLTAAEEKYAVKWLDAGFDMSAVTIAYERTCLNTGGLNWSYMDKILMRWKEKNLLTAESIGAGDTKPGYNAKNQRVPDQDEQEAIRRALMGES